MIEEVLCDQSPMIVQSNKLIEASYKISMDEQRLLLTCLSKINSRAEMSSDDVVTITAKEYATIAKIKMKTAYQQLESACEHLFDRKLTFYDSSEDTLLDVRWFSSAKYYKTAGQVELMFAQKVIPLISSIKKNFTQYNLEQVHKLKSVYAIRIYELCLQKINSDKSDKATRSMSVDELKFYLGIEDQYEHFKALNLKIIKPALKQINDNTNLRLSVTFKRAVRNIVGLTFLIENKVPRPSKISSQKAHRVVGGIIEEMDIPKLTPTIKNRGKPKFTI